MIHDKDYIIRIVKQFSEFLSKMILGGKDEGELCELERVFETNMNDTFKMNFDELSSKSIEELTEIVESKDTAHHIPYFELLGHLFYFKFKQNGGNDLAEKATAFYSTYLQKSGIFSMPIVSRMTELKAAL